MALATNLTLGFCGIATASLCALTMPPWDLAPLAPIAFVPLLWAMRKPCARWSALLRRVLLGWVTGALATLMVCPWAWTAISEFDSVTPPIAALVWCLFLLGEGSVFAVATLVYELCRQCGTPRWVAFPVAAILAESATTQLAPFSLATMVHSWTPALQLAELGGRLAILALVALVNSLLLEVVLVLPAHGRRKLAFLRLGAVATIVALVSIYAKIRVHQVEAQLVDLPRREVLAINPQVARTAKRSEPRYVAEMYLRRTLEASGGRSSRLIVWGETAMPQGLTRAEVRGWLERNRPFRPGDSFVFGAAIEREGVHPRTFINAAVSVGTRASDPLCDECVRGKTLLLPFAETPLMGLGGAGASFESDGGVASLPLADGARAAIVICNEILSAEIVGEAMADAGLIINISSDAWFPDSRAAELQLAAARLRAVEYRRYVVRSAANGTSAVVDPLGRLEASDSSGLLRSTVLLRFGVTPYERWGDWPVLGLCTSLALAFVGGGIARSIRPGFAA